MVEPVEPLEPLEPVKSAEPLAIPYSNVRIYYCM